MLRRAPLLAALAMLAAPAVLVPVWSDAARAEDELPATHEFFDTYDANLDGKVTQDEFRGSSEIFRLLDKDGSGEITPTDLGLPAEYKPDRKKQGQRQRAHAGRVRGGEAGQAMEQLLARLAKLDLDGDGRVSREEWKGRDAGFARLDRNGDGFLDAQDRTAARKGPRPDARDGEGSNTGGHDGAETARLEAEARERFAQLDRDGDGTLGAGELPNERFLALLDGDGDGRVTEAEFLAFAKRRAGMGRGRGADEGEGRARGGRLNAGMLRRWDTDRDGTVSRKEFPGGDAMFARLDRNGDGALDKADLATDAAPADAPPKDAPPKDAR